MTEQEPCGLTDGTGVVVCSKYIACFPCWDMDRRDLFLGKRDHGPDWSGRRAGWHREVGRPTARDGTR